MKKVKKLVASLIILLLSFGPLIGPISIYAEETTATNSAEVTTTVDSGANSGENQIIASPEPSPSPEPTPAPESTSSAEITTGDTVAITEAENNVNTTEINSQVIYKTLNIFLSGDIDLTDSGTLQTIVDQAITENPQATTISVSYDGTNIAYVSNEIISIADSGNNTIDGGQEAVINTGDAYSVVSLLNQVNTTIIDSQIYLVTINIFGDVTANIILPELTVNESNDQAPCCDQDVTINNQATVSSQISSQAVSGQNTVVAQTNAQIESGDAQSSVNVVNVVNANLINTTIINLVINVLGSWIGSWLGADDWQATGSTTDGSGCPDCIDDININNQAVVENQITSLASSGGNNISAQSGRIKTGKAFSSVSLFNFINTSIINSRGFWGFINIFGRLTGNVGTAADLFPEPTPTPTPTPEPETTASSEPASRETGGLLAIEQTNNVGEYVLPGDTVTFNVLVKNPGGGKVYDAKLVIELFKDGVNMGGGEIGLGDIEAKKGVKVSTGLVLSGEAEAGEYIARAEAIGYVGPNNEEVRASADSSFLIVAFTPAIGATGLTTPAQATSTENVLGETVAAGLTAYDKLLRLFLVMLLLLAALKAIEKREKLAVVWAKNIRPLLFSLLALFKSS